MEAFANWKAVKTALIGLAQPAVTSLTTTLPQRELSSPAKPLDLIDRSVNKPTVHLVKAGASGFQFEPAQLDNVAVGDIVTFEFYPPDHSVARAEYGSACMPYEYTGRDKTGFWSETQWVHTVDKITHWNLTINSTEPIFYYCAAPDSCTGQWMVGAINPNSSQTLDFQRRAAQVAKFQVAPGEPIPREASSTPSVSTPKLSGGAIAGIVLGGVVLLALIAGLLLLAMRRKVTEDATKQSNPPSTPVNNLSGAEGYIISPLSPEHSGKWDRLPGSFQPTQAPPPVELPSYVNKSEQW